MKTACGRNSGRSFSRRLFHILYHLRLLGPQPQKKLHLLRLPLVLSGVQLRQSKVPQAEGGGKPAVGGGVEPKPLPVQAGDAPHVILAEILAGHVEAGDAHLFKQELERMGIPTADGQAVPQGAEKADAAQPVLICIGFFRM